MNPALAGLFWALAFVALEAVQFVYFGGLFQRMNSFMFGFLVFGITSVLFVSLAAWRNPAQIDVIMANLRLLITVNVSALLAWGAFLTSVQLIEPAVAYTIGAGVMPIATWLAWKLGVAEGEAMRSRTEALGNIIVSCGLGFLAVCTVLGLTGFVRGGAGVGALGVAFAIADGVFFVALLIFCQRMDRVGVIPSMVFGLRFPLYVVVAGGIAFAGGSGFQGMSGSELVLIVAIGLVLVVPPLYALQRAVALVSTLTLSTVTALGPFVIFVLQMVEGRVEYSTQTLIGLFVYSVGALLAAYGAVRWRGIVVPGSN
ncbi:MAG: hypothetical protein GY947_19635 [Rhodobacteraceae bacterium]|nr:hypothetical protein [Paracoccaceae bacterium]